MTTVMLACYLLWARADMLLFAGCSGIAHKQREQVLTLQKSTTR